MAQEPETTTKRAELPMRLTRLRVKNFRSIADIDIPLSPLTVLVGPNGSGKSNVVDALRFVRDVFARGLDQAVMDREGMGVIQRWGTEGEGITIGFTACTASYIEEQDIPNHEEEAEITEVTIPSSVLSYEFTILSTKEKGIEVKNEKLTLSIDQVGLPIAKGYRESGNIYAEIGDVQKEGTEKKLRLNKQQNDLGIESLFDTIASASLSIKAPFKEEEYSFDAGVWEGYYGAISRIEASINGMLFYTLNPADLRQPQQTLKETSFDEKGRNLAAVLRRLSRGDDWDSLRFALRRAVVGFDTLEVEPVGGYLATKLIYQTGGTSSRASYLGQESDGTIRMLGLLAALYQGPSQSFISIEEPEANIHPGALAVLAGVIDEASLRSQILVTTHSPDMLDYLPVESFLVVEKVGDTTHVGPLDASQIASVRKRLFTPGELFRMEGLQRQVEPESAP